LNNSSVFITGATGLVGKAILNELSQFSFQVTALHREKSILPDISAVSWVEGDLADSDTYLNHLLACDVVIHAAANVEFNPKFDQKTLEFNTSVTKDIVQACIDGGKRLIHISSVAALNNSKKELTTEESEFDLNLNHTGYAKSKYFSEMEVWRGIAEGLDAVILNPSIILGIPSEFPESSGIFWKQVDKGMPRIPAGGSGFVDARDVAKVVYKLIDSDISGERFVISGDNLTYKEFFGQIATALQQKPPTTILKTWESKLLYMGSSFVRLFGISPTYSKALHDNLFLTHKFDSSKAQKTFGMEFRSTTNSVDWVTKAYLAAK